jgi:hypothetical protein
MEHKENEKSVLDQIVDIVDFYYKVKEDFNDIERLQKGVRRLATLIFMYAGEVGSYYKEKNRTEFVRRSTFEKEKNRLIKTGESGTAAGAAALVFVEMELQKEQQADAEYKAAHFLYESAKDVLQSMQQHVSNLKQEKRLEMAGGMTQP